MGSDTTRSGRFVVAHSPPGTLLSDTIIAAYRVATSLARFSWVPFLSDPKLERRLRRVTAPTLVVAPDDDRLIPVAHARRYAERIPGARYAGVKDCAHVPEMAWAAVIGAGCNGLTGSALTC